MGLVGWWQSENNATDSASTNQGTLVGNTSFAAGRVGQAFVFDGSGDGVSLGNPTAFQVQSFTIECWLRRSSTSVVTLTPATTAGLFHYGSLGIAFGIFNEGYLFLSKVDIDNVNSTTVINDTNWHHAAITKSDSTVIFYIDGVASPAPAYDPGFVFTSPVAIGARGNSIAQTFYGAIDEMSFYDRALSAEEVQAIFNAGSVGKCLPAPVIVQQPVDQTVEQGDDVIFSVSAEGGSPLRYQWMFDTNNLSNETNASLILRKVQLSQAGGYSVLVTNASGSTNSATAILTVNAASPCTNLSAGAISWWRGQSNTLDSVGNNHGSLAGNAAYESGFVRSGFIFDGDTDAVQLGNPASLRLQDFTIEAWIKRSDNSIASSDSDARLFSYGSGGYGFGMQHNGQLFLAKTGVDSLIATNGVTDTGWHHVAVTKAGTNVIFYVDGTNFGAASYSGVFTFGSSLAIGARGDNLGNSFLGSIDELTVYNRALSSNEVYAVYSAPAGGKCSGIVAPFTVAPLTNLSVGRGSNATFTVVVGGSVPFDYRWSFNGMSIAGATASSLTITNAQSTNAGTYVVIATNVSGFTSNSATLTVTNPPAAVRVVATNAMAGRPVTVGVDLVANGNENTLAFSLNFTTSRLTYNSAALGSGAGGATLSLNTNSIASGRLGVIVYFPDTSTFSAGTQRMVNVTFNSSTLLGVSTVNTTVSFGDTPVVRQLSDPNFQSLAATYSSGTVTLSPTIFEADVSPRPGGNQSLAIADSQQLGRFVARLDTPAAGGEFQRTDCAPSSSGGDGQLKVADWVLAGRYALGLDVGVAVSGPTNEAAATISTNPASLRQIKFSSLDSLQGQTTVLTVSLDSQGNENALGFTLAFDASAFTYTGATLGSGAAGGSLLLNTNQIASGRLGIAVGLPTGNNFTSGTREVARINFNVAPGATNSYPVTCGDQIVLRSVASALADDLTANFTDAAQIVHGSPALTVTCGTNSVVLSWPVWAGDFALQEGTPWQGNWTNVMPSLSTNGSFIEAVQPASGSSRLFRLRR